MLSKISVLYILTVLLSCSKTLDEDQKMNKVKDEVCTSVYTPNLIVRTKFELPNVNKAELMQFVEMHIDRIKEEEVYLHLKIDPINKGLILSLFKYSKGRTNFQLLEPSKVGLTQANLRTIGWGTATAVKHAFDILWGDICNNPGLYAPCEQELTMFEWGGVYYLEDCC